MAGLIISILVGLLGIILSICVKKYKMTSLIAGFNPKKHDEEKMAKIAGDNLLVVPEYENIINTAESISVVALVIKIIYCTNKYGLKEN